MHRLGDVHRAIIPFFKRDRDKLQAAPDFECYAKVCRNCGYTDLYSAYLIDEFEDVADRASAFGEISRAPGGQRLLSIFVSYKHHGELATDFTVPISDGSWFVLKSMLNSLADEQVLELVLPEPYKKAWLDRVGPIPDDFVAKVRALIEASPDEAN